MPSAWTVWMRIFAVAFAVMTFAQNFNAEKQPANVMGTGLVAITCAVLSLGGSRS